MADVYRALGDETRRILLDELLERDGPVIVAVFDDTCGNFLQLAQFTG